MKNDVESIRRRVIWVESFELEKQSRKALEAIRDTQRAWFRLSEKEYGVIIKQVQFELNELEKDAIQAANHLSKAHLDQIVKFGWWQAYDDGVEEVTVTHPQAASAIGDLGNTNANRPASVFSLEYVLTGNYLDFSGDANWYINKF